MTTRIRDLDDGACREWSAPIVDPKQEPPLRLSVLAEQGGLLRIGVISVTSRSENAEELDGQQRVFWATKDDVRWLLEHLPAALAYADSTPPRAEEE